MEMNLEDFSGFPAQLMIFDKRPFSLWKPEAVSVPSGLETWLKNCVNVYQVVYFLDLTTEIQGIEVAQKALVLQRRELLLSQKISEFFEATFSQIMMAHFKYTDRLIASENRAGLDGGSFESYLAMELVEIWWKGSFRKNLEASGLSPEAFNTSEVIDLLAVCLAFGKSVADDSFLHFISSAIVLDEDHQPISELRMASPKHKGHHKHQAGGELFTASIG